MIIARYDTILDQSECLHLYYHLSNNEPCPVHWPSHKELNISLFCFNRLCIQKRFVPVLHNFSSCENLRSYETLTSYILQYTFVTNMNIFMLQSVLIFTDFNIRGRIDITLFITQFKRTLRFIHVNSVCCLFQAFVPCVESKYWTRQTTDRLQFKQRWLSFI